MSDLFYTEIYIKQLREFANQARQQAIKYDVQADNIEREVNELKRLLAAPAQEDKP